MCREWKEGRHLVTAFAVGLEIPKRFHQPPFALLAKGVCANPHEINVLAVSFGKDGLVVEGIDVTGATRHEYEDDAFGSLEMMGDDGGQRIACGGEVTTHSGEGK